MHWRRLLLLGLLLALLTGAASIRLAPETPLPRSPTLRQGLLAWYLVRPGMSGGPTWWNLLPRYAGALQNMGAGSGWSATFRAGWAGEMRFDGADDRVSLGSAPIWQFSNTIFTVGVRFRFTGTGTGNLLTQRTQTTPGASGGYFLRIDGSTGTLTVRLMATGANPVAQRSTLTSGFADGRWHSAVVVYRTDTTVIVNNDVAIFADGAATDQTGLTQTASTAYEPCEVVAPGCELTLGMSYDGTSPFLGAIDDVRIWQRGLSAAEALAYHRETLVDVLARDVAFPWLGTLPPPFKRRVVIQ